VSDTSFHHVGYAVSSIERSLPEWCAALHPIATRGPFDDPLQRARVLFLEFAPSGATQLELIEPLGLDTPLVRFLEKGGGLHHVCFEVDDLENHIGQMKACKAMLIRRPQPAVAFQGRKIAWMATREKLLVEYLERNQVQ
jgi:methylmalonyl-CoA/ethylmalonyl-CoA epimerase